MYAKTLSALAILSAAAVAAQDGGDGPTINTPSFVAQCKPTKLTWKGGQPPYHIYITQPGQIDQVIEDLGETQSTSKTWKVSVDEGKKFTINLCDQSGQCKASGEAGPVGKGDDSCKNGGSGGGSGGGAAAGGGSSGNSSSGGSKSSSSGGKSSSSSSSKSSSSSSPSSSSGGSESSSDSSSEPTGGAGGAGDSSSDSQPSDSGSDSQPSDSDSDSQGDNGQNGAAMFSGVPAVVAGVVGIVVAALI